MDNHTQNSYHTDNLTQINEELLRSKGKLMQEIVNLKKELIVQDKNLALIQQLQLQINTLNTEIANHLLDKSFMSAKIEDLKNELNICRLQKENAEAEINRINKITWYQRLFGKK